MDLFRTAAANTLCEFDGRLDKVVTEPIFVQKVYDAVLFNYRVRGRKTNQSFCLPFPESTEKSGGYPL